MVPHLKPIRKGEEKKRKNVVPEKQIAVVSSSGEPLLSNVGAHAGRNTFVAMAVARQPEHGDLMPTS